jgi:hypothetical protein
VGGQLMDELSRLAEEEDALKSVVGSLTGQMEEKTAQLEKTGVFEQYRSVFGRYIALLNEPPAATEALKRALFLGWYDLSEPACFTGLQLPDERRRWNNVCEAADATIERAEQDRELSWMLPYYYRMTDFAFSGLRAQPHLATFLEGANPEGYRAASVDQRQLRHRGQMGHYWQSIFDSVNRAI